jgi:hypothetical protein
MIKRLLVFLCVLLGSAAAFADGVPPASWNGVWVGGGGVGDSATGSSPMDTCQQIVTHWNSNGSGRVATGCFMISYSDVAAGASSVGAKVGFYIDGSGQEVNATGVCPAGAVGGTNGLCNPSSSSSSSAASCPSGLTKVLYMQTTCTFVAWGSSTGSPCNNVSSMSCEGGCAYTVTGPGDDPGMYGVAAGPFPQPVYETFNLTSTGQTCAQSPAGSVSPPGSAASSSGSASSSGGASSASGSSSGSASSGAASSGAASSGAGSSQAGGPGGGGQTGGSSSASSASAGAGSSAGTASSASSGWAPSGGLKAFDMDGANAAKQAARDEFAAKVDEIRGQASALWGNLATGSGALPCFGPVTVLGRSIGPMCLDKFQTQLEVIPALVLFAAAFCSIVIIFR